MPKIHKCNNFAQKTQFVQFSLACGLKQTGEVMPNMNRPNGIIAVPPGLHPHCIEMKMGVLQSHNSDGEIYLCVTQSI